MIIKNCKAGSRSDDLYTLKSLIVAQLCSRPRTPLCEVTGNMLARCNIRSRDPTLHTYWWSVPGCNEMMMITLRSHCRVATLTTDNTQTLETREITVTPVTFICHTHRATLSRTFYFFCFIDHREIQVLHSWEDLERYLFRTRRK